MDLEEVKERANNRIEYILSELGFDLSYLRFSHDYISGQCLAHESNNDSSFCYSTKYKTWRCWTARCDKGAATIFGLVSKILSKQQNREVKFRESLEWLCHKLDISKNEKYIEPTLEEKEVAKLVKESKVKNRLSNTEVTSGKFTPVPISVLDEIEPSWYFLEKGFAAKTLEKFKVGFCDDSSKLMYNRSFVPVLDESGKMMIGVSGRTKYEKCEFCPYLHDQGKGCPEENKLVRKHPKWMHFGFNSSNTLYNVWNNYDIIGRTQTIILTEGPKDVWWFDQHGIENSSCVFGLNIFPYHIKKLLSLGVTKVVLALNNDERGLEATEKAEVELGMYFKIFRLNKQIEQFKDISLIPPNYMKESLVPYIHKLSSGASI